MSENLGTGVSYVYESEGYNNVMVVFQKGKPPLDSELNLAQEQQRLLARRALDNFPSGWLSVRPPYTNTQYTDAFYTQNPTDAVPEYALVNGMVLYVTNTATSETNSNKIELSDPPLTGNKVNGIFLEVWRALLDPDTDINRPDADTVIDAIEDIKIVSENAGWAVGENGLVLVTENGGLSWNEQLSNTKRKLNSVSFINNTIGWAVGDSGTVIRTSSGGASWTVLPTGYTQNFNGTYAVSQLVTWIVGNTGTILKTTNGITWLPQNSKVTVNLNAVYFHDNLVGWVVGDSGTILKTTDGGSNWMTLHSGVTANLSSVTFYDYNFGFAVGTGGTILRSSDGGLSWVDQSGNVKESTGYTSLTTDLTDVKMIPTLDQYVDGEEVSSQFLGPNKNCTTMNVPITKGNGLGETTNNPADITVTVASSPTATAAEVLVDSIEGTTGQIILHEAPRSTDTVKVFYWYKACAEIFIGNVWITGKSGTLIATSDIGANWFVQDPNTAHDLNAVDFFDDSKGWVGGTASVIRHTENGIELTDVAYDPTRTVWTVQKSNVIVRQVRRVYNEGNVGTVIYLNDESIHPDTAVETTKRVQVQYRIRIVENVDPSTYPEAGLGSSAIVGLGPNTSGSFAYANQGEATGDYGLWEADCANTVDGKCWAVPMFFVNRRNSTPYNPESNTNGSHTPPGSIRYDLLTGTDVVSSDIWDVRRAVLVPSVEELLNRNYDLLLDNQLRTRFFRDTVGGDKYGTEILQLDRVQGQTSDGGTLISGSLLDVASGGISSNSELKTSSFPESIFTSVPDPITLPIPTTERGLFHPNLVYYSARYESNDVTFNDKIIPGYWTGVGTNEATFVFGVDTNTDVDDPNLQGYAISAQYVEFSTTGLTLTPAEPKLVKNYGAAGEAFFYHGVDDLTAGKVIEQWDTGITGNLSYSIAYAAEDFSDLVQQVRSSTVEVHWFIRLTSAEIVDTNEIKFSQTIQPDLTDDNTYSIYTVSRINNVVSGFSYKVNTLIFDKGDGDIHVTSLPGYEFLEGAVIEIVAAVDSGIGDDNIRNGASVNFTSSLKEINSLCRSQLISSIAVPAISSTFDIDLTGGVALGMSATETENSLTQHFCWFSIAPVNAGNPPGDLGQFIEVSVEGMGTNTLTCTILPGQPARQDDWYATVQVLKRQSTLLYTDDNNDEDGLLIGYNYVPYQSVSDLPLNLTVQTVTKPTVLNISNLGTGGSAFTKKPYEHPLIHIPTNDSLIADDNEFYNLDRFRFPDITLDNGYVQMPVYVPGSFGAELDLSIIADDNNGRAFYSVCSRDFQFITEGLQIAIPRKIFMGVVARVKESSDGKLLKGEYVLLVISRNELLELGNYTGYSADDKSVIAVYRLPNKPIVR